MRRLACLLIFLPACAGSGTAVRAAPAAAPPPAAESTKEPPRWNDPAAVKHLWPQGSGLAEAGVLCPFAYPKGDSPLRPTSVTYDARVRRAGAFSVHVEFPAAPGTPGSVGVGCLRAWDASRYLYVTFWLHARAGQRFRLRLRDAGDKEAIVERTAKADGWQRVVVPTADFAVIDLRRLATFGLVFDEELGPADLHLEHFEFADQ
jgi:hypothetical protein